MYQPYKTCPLCGQRAVLSMKACGRCGYAFPCPPAPLYTSPLAITPSASRLPGRRIAVWAASVILALCCLAGLVILAQRPPAYPFLGTWSHSDTSTLKAFTFNADGTGSGRVVIPSYRMDMTDAFTWYNTGHAITISYIQGRQSSTSAFGRTMPWEISDDGKVLILAEDGRSAEEFRRPN